jgi:hypothetical protein
VADADDGLIVRRKLKAISMVPKDLVANAVAHGTAIIGQPSCLDFGQRRIHEDDQETAAIFVRHVLAPVA